MNEVLLETQHRFWRVFYLNKMKEVKCGVYKITSPKGRVYIGESHDICSRWKDYVRFSCKEQRKLYYSLKKYGVDTHIFEIIEECDLEDLLCRERHWQDFYDVLNGGLNLKLTQCGDKKQVHSEETKKRMSESNSGENNFWFGKNLSEDTKLKLSNIRLEYYENNPPKIGKEHHLFVDRVGEVWETITSGKITIIEYINSYNCTIKFEDNTVRSNVRYSQIKKGCIKHPNQNKI